MKCVRFECMDMVLFWNIYLESFPEEERRTWVQQMAIMKDTRYHVNPIYHMDKVVGFYCLWKLDGFVFVEHIALMKTYRNLGIGTSVLKEIQRLGQTIILEVEPPETEIAIKRIKFYEKSNFSFNAFEYLQPSYHALGNPVCLCILSWPSKLSEIQFISIKNQLYQVVYHVEMTHQ